jgi:tRNA (guanine37-N1)-methyltransferase
MRSLAVVVPSAGAEEARRNLRDQGRLRHDLRVAHLDGRVAFPVYGPPDPVPRSAEVVELEFDSPIAAGPASYRELLTLPPGEAELLPRAFDVVGDLVLIRLPPELSPRAASIGEALLQFVPSARLVAWDHGVHGPERVRTLERIAGEGTFRTRHRENGLEIDVDLTKAYFSPRLAREHARVAGCVRTGERFADLCCGVGPFALHVARDGRAKSVVAVDRNPEAIGLLRENLARLGLEDRVTAVVAPLESFLSPPTVSDRAVLNLPHEGIKYVSPVSATVARGGTLHYFEVTPRELRASRGSKIVEQMQPVGSWSVEETHVVHPYSPDSDIVAYTFVRGPGP